MIKYFNLAHGGRARFGRYILMPFSIPLQSLLTYIISSTTYIILPPASIVLMLGR